MPKAVKWVVPAKKKRAVPGNEMAEKTGALMVSLVAVETHRDRDDWLNTRLGPDMYMLRHCKHQYSDTVQHLWLLAAAATAKTCWYSTSKIRRQ